ncbi:hypothetical protein [Legionella spiritensis]|uniref:SdhA, substrate of the Dot/Icm system n=1 Tax=Legionella spiritensis TaxID=452 RepID=A0A0W0Z6C5_LEGSP|nr:hypothetical protein [Legionella spiritensis]KTD64673.1 SdhA, substrate of the Dot/Icm system [Legionella spiritensis]SNV47817.1 SdhA, GRIP coiled-coil protein GCC185 [Legionella spiritensis]
MIEKYLKLLDSFKKHQLSILLHDLREKITTKLQNDCFSKLARHLFLDVQTSGEPYINFSSQPRQVVQIKEFINALYHGEQAFKDLESVELRGGSHKIQDLSVLYHHTTRHAYLASYLLTHIDLDLLEIFNSELLQLQSILNIIRSFDTKTVDRLTHKYQKQASEIGTMMKDYPLCHQAGFAAGIAVDQMRPSHGEVDYNFLTRFSAVLPGYIHQLTQYIHQFSSEITTPEATLTRQQVEELEENAFKLLGAIEELQGDSWFLSFKVLNYLRIIRHIIILSTSTLKQMMQMNDESQNVVRDHLAKLKYELLPNLLAIADRLEDQAMLTPGTLSKPLMDKIKIYYETLIFYTKKIVSFASKGEELLTIEDARFLALRLEETYQRINKARSELLIARRNKQAFSRFFALLEHEDYKHKSLIDLPLALKTELAIHYRYLQPVIEQYNVDLNNAIIRGLTESSSWTDRFKAPLNWYYGYRDTDKVSHLLSEKKALGAQFDKRINTSTFHIQINKNIIHKAETTTPLIVTSCPDYHMFSVNEKKALRSANDTKTTLEFSPSDEHGNRIVINYEALNSHQAFKLYQYYNSKQTKLDKAREAYDQFIATLLGTESTTTLNELPEPIKSHLKQQYYLFQPYLISLFSRKKKIRELDRAIIFGLSGQGSAVHAQTESLISIDQFMRLKPHLDDHFRRTSECWEQRRWILFKKAGEAYQLETETRDLKPNYRDGNRAHHILKHTRFSRETRLFRNALMQLTAAFNLPMQNKLNPQRQGLPYPEVETPDLVLAQSAQCLPVKRIANGFYHLEQVIIELEQLSDKSSESVYVYHLVQAYNHLNDIYQLSTHLYGDPYIKILVQDIMTRARALYKRFNEESAPYLESPEITPPCTNVIQYTALWYAMQGFMLFPEHIQALDEQASLPENKIKTIRKNSTRIVIAIERIIANSNNYFKLFLETPVMYGLFKELRAKLEEFTTSSHSAFMTHLEAINTDIFTRILQETDLWEAKLSLKPGKLSDPMKTILDHFYQGLVEPLGLVSQKHLDLLTTPTPLKCREAVIYKRMALAELQKKQYDPQRIILADLQQAIDRYIHLTTGLLPPPPGMLTLALGDLKKHYEKALPLFLTAPKWLLQSLPTENPHPEIDEVLNKRNASFKPVFHDIAGMAKMALMYYENRKASSKIHARRVLLRNLLGHIDDYAKFRSGYLPANDDIIAQTEKKLLANYRKVLPILYKWQRLDQVPPHIANSQPPFVDQVLNSAQFGVPVTVTNIARLTKSLGSYYQGLSATRQFEMETAKEQQRHLKQVTAMQQELNQQLLSDYLHKTFLQGVESIMKRDIGLLFTKDEYNSFLEKYLSSFQEEIMAQSQASQDIRQTMLNILTVKTRQFETEYLQKYLHLDNTLAALAEFNVYFHYARITIRDKTSLFESNKTIKDKKAEVKSLENLALNKELSIDHRLQELKRISNSTLFKTNMLKHRKFERSDFGWLCQCLLRLLSALHLYQPAHIKHYRTLIKSVDTKPAVTSSLQRHSLFAPPERSYNLPSAMTLSPSVDHQP